ncbi:GH32 C-terminal domain-containing protein [Terrabacter terrigena]|uniref:beta-fructofuranosidase n=1 Tax=Terrabacter terrigena TaxID=574718 RepID=A0ABW3MS77_9MICO
MSYSAFFQPSPAAVGDVIPVELDGVFWLFYLLERREDPKPGTPWALVRTKDFVRFDDVGVAFDHGDDSAPDFNVYTGSVVRDDSGAVHLYYTGQNPNRLGVDGQPLQVVRRASSGDGMATWVRDQEWKLPAPQGHVPGDWRDPFVLRDPRDGRWRMLVAGRRDDAPERRSGVIAQLTSTDLDTWTHAEPFWAPERYLMMECPDVFAWGDWWYLVYSEFTDSFTTRYRMSRSLDGPWLVPDHDTIDGRAFYAAKSADRDGRRFFFGWIASKEDARDDGAWLWAGTLSTLEARQHDDGTLAFGLPRELLTSFDQVVDAGLDVSPGTRLHAPDGRQAIASGGHLPQCVLVTAVFDVSPGTTEVGLVLRASDDGEEGYVVRLEPRRHRMVLDRWPRAVTGPAQWQVSGDVPFELERPADLPPGEHTLEVLLDGDAMVAVLDGEVALSARCYDRPSGGLAVFVGEGSTEIRSLTVRERSDT